MKRCSRCGEERPVGDFYPSQRHSQGVGPWCRSCVGERNAERDPEVQARRRREARQRDKEATRASDRRRRLARFGITPEDYDQLLADQGGACACCGQPETARGNHGEVKALAVDHDHETGQVRALLCQPCNLALGVLGEDPDRITALLVYAIKARDNTDTAKVPPVIGP